MLRSFHRLFKTKTNDTSKIITPNFVMALALCIRIKVHWGKTKPQYQYVPWTVITWKKIKKRSKELVTWNPFPLVIPVTSTYCPGTKWRTPISAPTGRSASSVTGNSFNFLFIGTPWALKWPTSGFVKCFSFFCPQPIWLTQQKTPL